MGSMISEVDISVRVMSDETVSNTSSDTEPYDLEDIGMDHDHNHNTDVIDVEDTLALPNGTTAPQMVDNEEDDEDCVLIQQPVETIDLCQVPTPRAFRIPVLSDEVIEIIDSPGIQASRNQSLPVFPVQQPGPAPKKVRLNMDDSLETRERGTLVSCPICLESTLGRNPVSTNCGHVFCQQCIQASLQIGKKCPMCKKNLPGKNPFHKIFF
jgi:Zinc finger, C3HC4 type (RING finger)